MVGWHENLFEFEIVRTGVGRPNRSATIPNTNTKLDDFLPIPIFGWEFLSIGGKGGIDPTFTSDRIPPFSPIDRTSDSEIPNQRYDLFEKNTK